MHKLITIEHHTAPPVRHGNMTITAFSKVLRLNIPGFPGGLVWNWPDSVLVSNSNGDEQIIPVRDVTRQTLWVLAGLTALVTAIILSIGFHKE